MEKKALTLADLLDYIIKVAPDAVLDQQADGNVVIVTNLTTDASEKLVDIPAEAC